MQFELEHVDTSSKARAGIITTSHGKIHTPIFMPVGTAGTVKAVEQRNLHQDVAAEIILGNTYHLYLRPGTHVLEQAGGLHGFINWNKPILTDSGGYQVYSLTDRRKITEQGVTFYSHIDGSIHTFTPENVIDTQRSIGSDIMMVLDECTPHPCTYTYARQSMEMTHRWLQRGIDQFKKTTTATNNYQTLFPIVQGSIYKDLRLQSAETIAAMDQPGNAIGGVCHPTGQLYEVTDWVCSVLPAEKPRYLMGVGTPRDLLECIALGIDMFDCVMPTRSGRNGRLFTTQGIINIKNQQWKQDFSPIDSGLNSYVSNHYTKAYLYHLFKSQEILGAQLASIHNLTFYLWLVKEARKQILINNFVPWKNSIIKRIMERL
ncbi:MAG: tRNA guanosine(34) transglycosylase Tgt [Candidatus Amoebophilus sp. 36-38]|nr:MAG: tRNA guanosine(34) transglycosylase Tgt [Candidatus Amoebophilus sp. 36-38]